MMAIVTPLDILDHWIGPARESAEAAEARQGLWFQGSLETDAQIARRFLPTLAALASGLDRDWAARGPRARLAAIVALDQFTRNVFRGTAAAFENDARARRLCLDGLTAGEDRGLAEAERVFFYLPLEHSEAMADQVRSVALYEQLAREARPDFTAMTETVLDYARRHRDVIARFARFPHRNRALGRHDTAAETDWLAEHGGF